MMSAPMAAMDRDSNGHAAHAIEYDRPGSNRDTEMDAS